jgi:hypothetical protein
MRDCAMVQNLRRLSLKVLLRPGNESVEQLYGNEDE